MAKDDPNAKKDSSYDMEPVCAAVLTILASGTVPRNFPPAAYPDAALSILLESSSRGPDLLALSSLGWSYGNGAGGGMGDWGECHYMPGVIGAPLEALEQSISLELAGANPTIKRRFKARFCTVGGLPPYTKAYDGLLWSPSVAGICVPAACDSDSLYHLFGEQNFVSDLNRLSLLDATNIQKSDWQTKRRRQAYVTALTKSFAAGRKFQEGVICEGDTGLPELDEHYRGFGYYFTCSILAILVICAALSTISNLLQRQNRGDNEVTSREEEITQIIENSSESSDSFDEDHTSPPKDSQETTKVYSISLDDGDCFPHNENSHFFSQSGRKILTIARKSNQYLSQKLDHFDAVTNFNEIASTSKKNISFFHGLRSISMLWIILGHTLVVQASVGYQNPAAVLPPNGMIAAWPAMVFFAARYSVDTFFFLSGFLVMQGLLRRFSETRPKNWAISFLLHRSLRILPTYMFVLLFWWKIAVTLGDGPFWPRWATFVAQCDKHAWTNVLFLNNLIPLIQPLGETSECMYHTWYLGVDFQLGAILAPIFLPLYLKRKQKAILIEFGTIIMIIVASFLCSHLFDWSGHLFDGMQTLSFDRGFYIQSFFRATPYIAGFITAQVWHELCQRNTYYQIPFPKLLSMISISTLIFLIFWGMSAYDQRPCLVWENTHISDCGSGWSKNSLAIYNSLVRPAWSCALAIFSLLALNGQLFCVLPVLNWHGWTMISKLSFGMYLLHPLTINIWFLRRTSKFYYSHIDFIFSFAAIVTITYFSALVLSLLVEWPMSKITSCWEKKISISDREYSSNQVSKLELNLENTENGEGKYLFQEGKDKETYHTSYLKS